MPADRLLSAGRAFALCLLLAACATDGQGTFGQGTFGQGASGRARENGGLLPDAGAGRVSPAGAGAFPTPGEEASAGTMAVTPGLPGLAERPQELAELRLPPSPATVLPSDIPPLRADALRRTAMSYGARGGLAWRSYQINMVLESKTADLDRIYAFRTLVIPAAGGMVVMPPVVSEAQDAFARAPDGQSAAAARRVFRVIKPGEIRSGVPTWKSYLVRSWEKPAPPHPDILPKIDSERLLWPRWVEEGWKLGIQQADAVFESDLDRLTRDFSGMARYRRLVTANVMKSLYVAGADLGVTRDAAGGESMRIGDRVVRITSPAIFNEKAQDWVPIVVDGDPSDAAMSEEEAP